MISVRRYSSPCGDGRDNPAGGPVDDLERTSVTRSRSAKRVADVVVARTGCEDRPAPGRSSRHEGEGSIDSGPAEIDFGSRDRRDASELAHREQSGHDIGNDHRDFGPMLAGHGQNQVSGEDESLAQLPGVELIRVYAVIAQEGGGVLLHRFADDGPGAGAGNAKRAGVTTQYPEQLVAEQVLGRG